MRCGSDTAGTAAAECCGHTGLSEIARSPYDELSVVSVYA